MKTNIKTIAMSVASALLLSTTGCSKNDFEYSFQPAKERELTGTYKVIEMCSNTGGMNGCTKGKEIEKINFTFKNKNELTITNTGVKEQYNYFMLHNEITINGNNKYAEKYLYRTSGDTLFMTRTTKDVVLNLTLLKKINKN